jgi:hypothetical protein
MSGGVRSAEHPTGSATVGRQPQRAERREAQLAGHGGVVALSHRRRPAGTVAADLALGMPFALSTLVASVLG